MTIKQAAIKFGKSENQIRAIIKDGLLNAHKEKGRLIISDNIEIIITKSEIQSFLLQIIKYKNNEQYVISRASCPSFNELKILARYLYEKGFIGKLDTYSDEIEFFKNVKLTETGFDFALGTIAKKTKSNIKFAIIPSMNVNIGLADVG